VLHFKTTMDRGLAMGVFAEKALRAGVIAPAEISFVPFGFMGWQLYPYFLAHDGRTEANIAGFTRYVNRDTVAVGQGYSRLLHVFPQYRHEPPADRHALLATHVFRVAWFFRGELFLLRNDAGRAAPAELALSPSEFARPWLPLTDDEWRDLI